MSVLVEMSESVRTSDRLKAADSRRVSTTRRDLRSITSDGVSHSVMVGMGETWLPAFALALGLGELIAGLMATVPMLAGAALQLVSPYGVRWFGSLRRWVVFCATIQGLSFVPLVVAAAAGHMAASMLFLVASVYWAAGLGTGPAWNAWVETLVPRRIRPGFFALRTRLAQVGVLAGLVGGGILLEYGRDAGWELPAFGAMFIVACLARLWSARSLSTQSEPQGPARAMAASVGRHPHPPQTMTQRSLMTYLLSMQAAVFVAGPFFNAWMLKYLQLSYIEFMVLIASSFVAKAVVLPRLGGIATTWGADRLLWMGALGIIPLPGMWLISNDLWWLLVVQILGGAAWAAHELGMLLLFFDSIPRDDRTRVLSVYNFANAAAQCVGTAAGAIAMHTIGEHAETYLMLFLASSVCRMMPVVLLVKLPHRVAKAMPIALRILAVRPSSGSLERPILADFETVKAAHEKQQHRLW